MSSGKWHQPGLARSSGGNPYGHPDFSGCMARRRPSLSETGNLPAFLADGKETRG
jgi:hypothetical protein